MNYFERQNRTTVIRTNDRWVQQIEHNQGDARCGGLLQLGAAVAEVVAAEQAPPRLPGLYLRLEHCPAETLATRQP